MNKRFFLVFSLIVLTSSYLHAQLQPQPVGNVKFHGQFIENFDKQTSKFLFKDEIIEQRKRIFVIFRVMLL